MMFLLESNFNTIDMNFILKQQLEVKIAGSRIGDFLCVFTINNTRTFYKIVKIEETSQGLLFQGKRSSKRTYYNEWMQKDVYCFVTEIINKKAIKTKEIRVKENW